MEAETRNFRTRLLFDMVRVNTSLEPVAMRQQIATGHSLLSSAAGAGVPGLRADFTEGAGYPPRVYPEGKRKLTESAREFPKASDGQTPEGSLREVRERLSPSTPAIFKNKNPLIFRPAGFVYNPAAFYFPTASQQQ